MALTDRDKFSNAPRRDAMPLDGGPSRTAMGIPRESLARLPRLHAEAARDARLGKFLARSVPAAGLLMLAGAASLLAGGGTLQSDFVWSVLVLAGIAIITLNHIRGQAGSSRRAKLDVAAADLRATLLYTGFAWGAGAFLALPADPGAPLALAFAILPSLAMALLLRDDAGVTAFAAPAIGLTIAAAFIKHWPGALLFAPLLLAAGVALMVFSYLQGGRVRLQPGPHGAV